MDIKLSDLRSIPNILSVLRILMIPLLANYYLAGDIMKAGIVIILSGITDLLDGFIARQFNQITGLGKILDPVADKLTQFSIILLLMNRNSLVKYLLILFVLKEFTMLLSTTYLHKKGATYDGAEVYGKISTFIFYSCMIYLFLARNVSDGVATGIIVVTGIAFIFSWSMYSLSYWRSYQQLKKERFIN